MFADTLSSSPFGLGHPEHFAHANPNVISVYGDCYKAQEKILRDLNGGMPLTQSTKKALAISLVYVRILAYLLLYGPMQMAQERVGNDAARSLANVTITEDNLVEEIAKLGSFYEANFIRIFRDVGKGRTPTHSHPSRPSFDLSREERAQLLLAPASSYSDLRKKVLLRDDYRDVLTGEMHEPYYRNKWKPEHPGQPPPVRNLGRLYCCHIITQSFNTNLTDNKKRTSAATAWNVLASFGYDSLLTELNGDGVHRLSNALTFADTNHKRFDAMEVWFEKTAIKHRYKIVTPMLDSQDREHFGMPEFVTFKAEGDVTESMLPDPDYLHLHACACKIAHMAGASGYYDMLQEFFDENGDGTLDGFYDALNMRLQDVVLL
ncbi:hypothetical protein PENSPDRAFT_641421 [Peniophora sp. CONT]|nr:hypothetical protein PENSPDRAFT_641421 [Peniophora sp. CONT]